jgi:diguanylate cyclase (GGDEF)-like protein
MLFMGGAMPVGLAVTVSSFAHGRLIPTFVMGGIAVVVGVSCFAVPHRVPQWVLLVLAPFGTLLIGLSSILNASAADGSELLYIWPVLYASYFLSLRAGLANVALIAAVYPPIAISLMGSPGVTPSVYLVGTSTVTVLIVANLRRRLQAVLQATEHEARTDTLTGLANRRGWDEDLAREAARRQVQGWPLSVLVIDLDHFKRLNDTLGHAAGDDALTRVAAVLRDAARRSDVVARLGGEEFGVILPGCPTSDAVRIAESLRLGVENASRTWEATVTISVGVASLPEHTDHGHDLVRLADEALYAAKRSGRNRVSVSGS